MRDFRAVNYYGMDAASAVASLRASRRAEANGGALDGACPTCRRPNSVTKADERRRRPCAGCGARAEAGLSW